MGRGRKNRDKMIRRTLLPDKVNKTLTIKYYLLTESEVITGNLRPWPWCIYRVIWYFPVMTKWTRLISYLWYMAFSLWTWACDQVKPTFDQRITLKNMSTQLVVHLRLHYNQVTLVSGYPFWQLSPDHNMSVHKDVHYQVKHRLYMPLTSSS